MRSHQHGRGEMLGLGSCGVEESLDTDSSSVAHIRRNRACLNGELYVCSPQHWRNQMLGIQRIWLIGRLVYHQLGNTCGCVRPYNGGERNCWRQKSHVRRAHRGNGEMLGFKSWMAIRQPGHWSEQQSLPRNGAQPDRSYCDCRRGLAYLRTS